MAEDNLIRHLIQDASNTQNQNRITILQHPLGQRSIKASAELQLRNEQQHDSRCTYQVEEESIRDIASAHAYIIDKVKGDVQHDEKHLQSSKSQRLPFIPKIRERQTLKGIHCNDQHHHTDIPRMVGIAHHRGYGMQEDHTQGGKQQRSTAHHRQDGRVNLFRIFFFLIDKAEEAGFHAVSEDDHQQGRPRIDLGHHTIATRCRTHRCRIDRHQQVIQETAYDATDAVNGRIFQE